MWVGVISSEIVKLFEDCLKGDYKFSCIENAETLCYEHCATDAKNFDEFHVCLSQCNKLAEDYWLRAEKSD